MPWARIAPYLTPEVRRQFWAKVNRDQDTPDACWLWAGAVNQCGYGMFYVSMFKRPAVVATRIAYYLANGCMEDDKFVCHACDNRACCNPKHLWLGSHLQNIQDIWKKGRGVTWNKGLKTGPQKQKVAA